MLAASRSNFRPTTVIAVAAVALATDAALAALFGILKAPSFVQVPDCKGSVPLREHMRTILGDCEAATAVFVPSLHSAFLDQGGFRSLRNLFNLMVGLSHNVNCG